MFEVLQLSDDYAKFSLTGVDVAMANALRRIMIAEVQTMAIEDVLFRQNSTIFQNEYLAHRLGMIPLRMSKTEDEVKEVQFSVDVTAGTDDVNFTSHDIKCHTPGVEIMHGSPNGILLAKLMPGQRLVLEATAVWGTGATHAKWSPVCAARYSYVPRVTVLPSSSSVSDLKLLASKCPKNVFDIEDDELVAKRSADCTLCGECTTREAKRLVGDHTVMVDTLPNRFIFDVESTGSLPAVSIVSQALDVLMAKCDTLLQRVNTLPLPPQTPPGTPMDLSYQED